MKKSTIRIPLYITTAARLREDIEHGLFVSGELVSQRKISEKYGVSKKTAAEALEILQSEGLIITKPQVGSYVNSNRWLPLVDNNMPAWDELIKNSSSVPSSDKIYSVYQLLSSNPEIYLGGTSIGKDFNFHKPVKAAMERALHRMDELYNVNMMGMPSLRKNIAKHMLRSGVRCNIKNILVAAGPMEALSVVLLSVLRRGMKLFIESTSSLGAPTIARLTGVDIVRINMDEYGIIPEDFIEKSRKVKSNGVLVVSPVNQWPTGASLSKSRRDLIMSTCISKNMPIVEYDLLRDFRHDQFPRPFKSFDENNIVSYIGSLLSAYQNMKIGWVIAPDPIMRHIADTKTQYEVNTNTLVQLVADEMLGSGVYDDYIEEYTPRFLERLALCRLLFDKYFTGIASWSKNMEGFYQWLEFEEHINTYDILKRLKNTFVHSSYFFNPNDIRRFYINPMKDSIKNLEEGLKEIANVVKAMS